MDKRFQTRIGSLKESDIQRAILDYLAAERIWHMRLNTGAMQGAHKGKRWFVRFGKPGMADILATPLCDFDGKDVPHVLWIEVKAKGGVLSTDQKMFRKEVNGGDVGHSYLVARSVDDVAAWMKENR